ncbi:MAG: hypothetical protein HFJ44_06350 [Clostridia bacterium]|jgi:hypothetical protein|nr:hypothetical protein [Clostridia bacterium]
MSINVETKKAYTEVVKVLNSLPDNDYRKIPEDVMLTLEKNMDTEYEYYVDLRKPLTEWKISEKAQTILAIIFRDYLATKKQKEKILDFEKVKINELEEEKRKKYNPDNIFEKRKIQEEKEEVVSLVEQKESFWKKIIKKVLFIIKKDI